MGVIAFPAATLGGESGSSNSFEELELLEIPVLPAVQDPEGDEGPTLLDRGSPVPTSMTSGEVWHDPGPVPPVKPPIFEPMNASSSLDKRWSPAGCTGSTDYPHATTFKTIQGRRVPTQVSVHGRIRCSYGVQRLETVSMITRDEWYGLSRIAIGSSYSTNSRTSYDATPHRTCLGHGLRSYRGYSEHASLEGRTIYRSATRNWQLPGMSRFRC